MPSNIARIVDYSAVLAAGIPGVKSIWATGQGFETDPFTGKPLLAAQESPAEEYAHFSDLPGAPSIVWVTNTGTEELTWVVPMRLWFQTTDYAVLRQKAMPFYDGYLAAFARDRTLRGLCLRARIASFAIGMDPEVVGRARWAWLDPKLEVVEQVNY